MTCDTRQVKHDIFLFLFLSVFVSVLLSAHIERYSVTLMQEFFCSVIGSKAMEMVNGDLVDIAVPNILKLYIDDIPSSC